jgi:hypothetical protein
LATIKQDERQFGKTDWAILWLDFDDPNAFPLPIGTSQCLPIIGGGQQLSSGALWWAHYGQRGDPLFDRYPLREPGAVLYAMEFDGRFKRGSRVSVVLIYLDGTLYAFENHAAVPMPEQLACDLVQLDSFNFEHSWLNWPVPGSLSLRIEAAREAASRLPVPS